MARFLLAKMAAQQHSQLKTRGLLLVMSRAAEG